MKRLLIGSLWAIWAVLFVLLLLLLFVPSAVAATPTEDRRRPAEKSGYRTTPRYDETLACARRVPAEAPGTVRIEVFGNSLDGLEVAGR